jgi:hypothetical protein
MNGYLNLGYLEDLGILLDYCPQLSLSCQMIRRLLDYRLYRIYEGVFVYDVRLWWLKMSVLSTFTIISTQVAPQLHQGSSGKAAQTIS